MITNEDECEGCGRGPDEAGSERHRCSECGKRCCADCTNHPSDDVGPCVECEAKRPDARIAYPPMDNGAVHIRWCHEDPTDEGMAEFRRAVGAWLR